jgi:small subunit ribosomal protein S9
LEDLNEDREERPEAEQPGANETPTEASETPAEASETPAETPAEKPAEAPVQEAASTEPPAADGGESAEAPAESAEAPAESAEAPAESAEAPPADSAQADDAAEEPSLDGPPAAEEAPPVATPVDLGPDARYFATGKRKSSVARVIVRPGNGAFDLNGRSIDDYFPRPKHRAVVRQPLEVTGYLERVDIRARIHGGGVGGQADALRHGIAKALIEADPHLRGELKRRQLLTRDPRVKERRKAGLKKARKRPQFSKR